MKNILKFIIAIATTEIAGGVSGFLTFDSIKNWYSTLNKPFFNPPDFIFGPVWVILYLLMGISLFIIWKEAPGTSRTRAFLVFGIQLFLNFWWSIFFFTFKRPDLAMVEIVCLWLVIVWMIWVFRQLKPVAGYLQIPYLLWVTFASVLNAAIYLLN